MLASMVNEDGSGHMDTIQDVSTCVEELHKMSAADMKKSILEIPTVTLCVPFAKGTSANVDMEKLADVLPLHLLASAAASIAQPRFPYLLRGIRLLHTMGGLASKYPKLEQMLLQEVTRREQIIDLVIFMLVVLADVEPDGRWGTFLAVLHSALVTCSLFLLKTFITSDWRDVAAVLIAHPKVDIFIDAAFDSVRRDINLLQARFTALSSKHAKETSKSPTASGIDQVSSMTLQQCEASVQILQALVGTQGFRDRILNHKELCRKGGILLLVLSVLRLKLPDHLQETQSFVASIARLKSKALAMLLRFCEAENVSFLDEVAIDARSLHLAKLVAGEVVLLVKMAFVETFPRDSPPMGTAYLNSMRLADVLSDDSNFRNLFMDNIAHDLGTILAMSPSEFRSKWCGGIAAMDMGKFETDATLTYDPFQGSGAAMISFMSSSSTEPTKVGGDKPNLTVARPDVNAYAHELSALLVKLFANLHCFNPDVCPADEKDRFLCLFMQCLTEGPFSPSNSSIFTSTDQTAVLVCENLHILVHHVASLPPDLANDEDVQLASVFAAELHEAFCLSPDSSLEAIADVRDAHEKRLKGIVSLREQSERWRKLQRPSEADGAAPTPAEGDEQAAPTPGRPETSGLHATEETSSAVDSMAECEQETRNPAAEAGAADGDDAARQNGFKALPEETPAKNNVIVEESFKEETPVQPDLHSAGPSLELRTPASDASRLGYESGDPWSGSDRRMYDDGRMEPRKRQRRIMSEKQIALMEKVLDKEPELQRYPETVVRWTAELNKIGPEISCNQLKNWINNRKAKLAKMAKEGRIDTGEKLPRAADPLQPDRHNRDASASGSGRYFPYQQRPAPTPTPKPVETKPSADPSSKIGQVVILRDETGRDVAMGTIQAITPGERGTGDVCLVKVSELKVDRNTRIPIGSDSLGTTFDEAERKLGSMIVAWRFNNLLVTQ